MNLQTSLLVRDYMRSEALPTTWCPGCGLGIIMSSIVQAIHYQGLDKNKIAMVSGIGCTGRMSGYTDFNSIHTTHGRAPVFATGLKLARPDMKVFVIMGDGDAMSIGGNHLINAIRRNIELTAIVVNNNIYGLTGGQTSPTTPQGSRTSTARHRTFERPMSLELLARSAGAPFFARGTVNHTAGLTKMIEKAMDVPGFALVEVLSNCHVLYGKMNEQPDASEMIANMDRDTYRSNAALSRRANQVVINSSSKVSQPGDQTTTVSEGVTRDDRVARGVIFENKGSIGFTSKYFNMIEQIQRNRQDTETPGEQC